MLDSGVAGLGLYLLYASQWTCLGPKSNYRVGNALGNPTPAIVVDILISKFVEESAVGVPGNSSAPGTLVNVGHERGTSHHAEALFLHTE